MKTISVAEACQEPLGNLYTSHRGGRILSISESGGGWYVIRVEVTGKERQRYSTPESVTRQVRGERKLYVRDR